MKVAAVIIFISGYFIAGCGNERQERFTGSGNIEATEVRVSSQLSGTILSFPAREGYFVEQGDILAEIDTKDIKLQREAQETALDELSWRMKLESQEILAAAETQKQAEILLENSKKNYDRVRFLFNEEAATQEQLDRAETEYSLALSRLESAKIQFQTAQTRANSHEATARKIRANLRLLDNRIAQGTITSPIKGTVIKKYFEEGETAFPGAPLLSIVDLEEVKLVIYVNQTDLGNIRIRQRAFARIDSHPSREFEGAVTHISSEAEFTPRSVQTRESRAELVYAVEITLPNPEGVFKIGMPADGYIEGL